MPLRAIFFDFGGTLDGPADPWVERFRRLYAAAGRSLPDADLERAFGKATRRAYHDPRMRYCSSLRQTAELHVGWQLEALGWQDAALSRSLVEGFVDTTRSGLTASRALLVRLRARARLGVISNFYGNVALLLAEARIAPLLDTIIDSNLVGVAKPDPRIFRLALEAIGCGPDEALYVGDSFDKDIVGAHAAGMRAAWLVPPTAAADPRRSEADYVLHHLADLEALL